MATAMNVRKFDLNIEKVLEHWTVAHALREVIANALDEQALTHTAAPLIMKDDEGRWHVQDFGRGLKYEHLTQKESREKLKNAALVIGKFGVGLKDAFATFDRHHIHVLIRSPHGNITTEKDAKHGFADLKTLHAIIHPATEPIVVGTEFILAGLKDEDVAKAKDFFLLFSGDELLEETKYGSVLRRASAKGRKARIYVNGLCVAEEENFLFSYNITSLTTPLRKALNRERTNVGRGAYTDRVKAILLECTKSAVADELAHDLSNLDRGLAHDELLWQEVQLHACRILNANEKVLFVTSEQLMQGGPLITYARNEGRRIIVIPVSIAGKLGTLKDIQGQPIHNLDEFRKAWDNSFHFTFVPEDQLSTEEQNIYKLTQPIMKLLGKRTSIVKAVLISDTMRLNVYNNNEALGLWESAEQRIIIKRDQLRSLETYAGTLLHELTHALSDTDDETLEFEQELTSVIGKLAALAFNKK